MKLRGVLPIIPTPFDAAGEVDTDGVALLVDHAVRAGAGAVVFPGVASEDLHLRAEERAACLAAASAAAAGHVPLIAGINSDEPGGMVALAEQAASHGADAIMAMAIPAMERDFAHWFARIAAATGGLPIILQNVFRPRGADLSAEAMLRLAREVPAIRYVKEEGVPSGPKVSALVAGCGADLDGVIGGGGGRYLFEELERGIVATMPALELLEIHVALIKAYAAGQREAALRLYERTLPLLLIQAPYRMRMTKLILVLRGLIASDVVREPVPEMDQALKALVQEYYARLADLTERAHV
ncbi:dihydrodipicolinate synthase family protein [Chelativorans xinjiangense]|uniref:dihydrodipicolinate synthase family protein n=1 Tax=Chelativorans xinjiangense TaxID=2681485 RepID=UPI001359A688|nr:dihydrodipicolinate synthase family protein [Chelativorans xinjiangense]